MRRAGKEEREEQVEISPDEIREFRQTVWDFHRTSRRDLPWRDTRDPYRILVSEIMLQQTQVGRVLVKYPEFTGRFPDIRALAAAPLGEVLAAWQGLGYNRRARYLLETARIVDARHGGIVPGDPAVLVTFPGIGRATACSIATFAYDLPVAFIETNIRRVFLHHFFPDRDGVADRQILPLVARTLDRAEPREWCYALMDYGTHLASVIENPNRRSRHYQRQQAFAGSDREIRGRILRLVLGEPGIPVGDLPSRTGCSPDRLAPIIGDLEREQLLVRDSGGLRIRD